MKTIKLYGTLIVAFMLLLLSCSEDKTYTKVPDSSAIVAPVWIQPSYGDTIIVALETATESAAIFQWTPAEYGVVVLPEYLIMLDDQGGDFSNAYTITSTKSDSLSVTQEELNLAFVALGFATDTFVMYDMKVASVLNSQYDTVWSEAITCITKPYPASLPPIYMIGTGVSAWDLAQAVELAATSTTDVYYTKWEFKKNGAFRFFSDKDWNASLGGYNVFADYPTDILGQTGDTDFNFEVIADTGWFEITVDVSANTVAMTAIDEPLLYLTGDATHGWNWGDSVTSIPWVGYEVWEGEVYFTNGGYFRCFTQKDWGHDNFGCDQISIVENGYLENDGQLVEADWHYLEASGNNWHFIGATGTYTVRVDRPNATITITP